LLVVHVKRGQELGENVVEGPGLLAAVGLARIPVHRIALPHHHKAGSLDSLNDRRQHLLHLARAKARDEGDAAGLVARVHSGHEPHQLLGHRCRADLAAAGSRAKSVLPPPASPLSQGFKPLGDFPTTTVAALSQRRYLDAHRIGNAAEVLHVGPVQLPGAVADPEEVCAKVVVLLALLMRHGFLKVENQACSREQGAGSREQGAGSREQGAGRVWDSSANFLMLLRVLHVDVPPSHSRVSSATAGHEALHRRCQHHQSAAHLRGSSRAGPGTWTGRRGHRRPP